MFLYFRVVSYLENLEKDQEKNKRKQENQGIWYEVAEESGKVNELFHEFRLVAVFLYIYFLTETKTPFQRKVILPKKTIIFLSFFFAGLFLSRSGDNP